MSLAVTELWRYPVKSLRGERLERAEIGLDGVGGDRLVHARESGGRVVTARFRPRLLGLQGGLGADGEPTIDGRSWTDRAALAAVREASTPDVELVRFAGPDHGQRFDVLPLTVLTDGMATAMGVDHRRFRPNIFITGVDGLGERDWAGHAIRIGSALIGVKRPRPRCVMTTFHPDTLEREPAVLRRIAQEFGGRIALDCWVIEPGSIDRGARVAVTDLPAGTEAPPGNASQMGDADA